MPLEIINRLFTHGIFQDMIVGVEGMDDDVPHISYCDKTARCEKNCAFWKEYNIREAIDSVYQAWQKVSGSTMRCAWKFLLPNREDNCRQECAQVEGIIQEITKVGISKLNLENLNAEVVKEVLESKLKELTNEDLLNFDVQNVDIDDSEEYEEDSSGDRVKGFSLKELGELLSAA
uniref:DDE-1 domain-containing protein n=1 Tax=Trichuris muris TaxID=70415 RepID=A0A5S6QXI8_TRIMR